MVKDWIANAYEGMSRRQFLARMTAAGASLAGFAIAANPVAGEVITTPNNGLAVADGKVASGGFQVPTYEARPAAPGNIRSSWSFQKSSGCTNTSRMSLADLPRRAS